MARFAIPTMKDISGNRLTAPEGCPQDNIALEAYVSLDFKQSLDERMTPINQEATVCKRVLKPGTPAKPIRDGYSVYFNFIATHECGGEGGYGALYDSNVSHENPSAHVFLHPSRCSQMAGLGLALKSMVLGEIARFLFSPEMAYGADGWKEKGVPKGAKVMFIIEILAVHDEVASLIKRPAQALQTLQFEVTLRIAARLADDGEALYLRKQDLDVPEAIRKWQQGATLLLEHPADGISEVDAAHRSALLSILLYHMTKGYLALSNPMMVESICQAGLALARVTPRDGVKLLMRSAHVRKLLGDREGAQEMTEKAMEIEPEGWREWEGVGEGKCVRWAADPLPLAVNPPSSMEGGDGSGDGGDGDVEAVETLDGIATPPAIPEDEDEEESEEEVYLDVVAILEGIVETPPPPAEPQEDSEESDDDDDDNTVELRMYY